MAVWAEVLYLAVSTVTASDWEAGGVLAPTQWDFYGQQLCQSTEKTHDDSSAVIYDQL